VSVFVSVRGYVGACTGVTCTRFTQSCIFACRCSYERIRANASTCSDMAPINTYPHTTHTSIRTHRTYTHAHALTDTQTHTHSLSLTHTHTHTHIPHTYTHVHTRRRGEGAQVGATKHTCTGGKTHVDLGAFSGGGGMHRAVAENTKCRHDMRGLSLS